MKYSAQIKQLLLSAGILRFSRIVFANANLAILRYHSVAPAAHNFYVGQSICLDPEIFEKQVAYISKRYSVINLDKVYNYLQDYQKIPKNSVVFTFDDGYADNYLAYKILRKYNASGTFYISAGCVEAESLWLFEVNYLLSYTQKREIKLSLPDRELVMNTATQEQKAHARAITMQAVKSKDLSTREDIRRQLKHQCKDVQDLKEKASQVMLSWSQIREMSNNGMTIASHTLSHLNLPNAKPEDAHYEILQSKKLLEEKIQKPVDHFSYPNGGNYSYYNKSIKSMVKQAGYKTATTSNNGIVHAGDDALELSRIRTTPHLAEILYQIDCEPLFSKK